MGADEHFCQLPLWLLRRSELNPSAKLVWAFIGNRNRINRNRPVRVSTARIAEAVGLSRNTVKDSLRRLVATGLIEEQRITGGASRYLTATPPGQLSSGGEAESGPAVGQDLAGGEPEFGPPASQIVGRGEPGTGSHFESETRTTSEVSPRRESDLVPSEDFGGQISERLKRSLVDNGYSGHELHELSEALKGHPHALVIETLEVISSREQRVYKSRINPTPGFSWVTF